MENVNYILQLNNILRKFEIDELIKPTHISLYMSLFKLWNKQRFPEVFTIYRNEVMDLAKIQSKTTYHKRIRELQQNEYLIYYPSSNPTRGSRIQMIILETNSDQKMAKTEVSPNQKMDRTIPLAYQKMVSLDKQLNTKTINQMAIPKNELIVLNYFKEKNWSADEAKKFFYYFEDIGWKMGGKIQIENWQACANSWILNNKSFSPKIGSVVWDNIQTKKVKDYSQPL